MDIPPAAVFWGSLRVFLRGHTSKSLTLQNTPQNKASRRSGMENISVAAESGEDEPPSLPSGSGAVEEEVDSDVKARYVNLCDGGKLLY